MSDDQKKVAAWVAIAVLCLAVVAATWLAFLAGQSHFAADPDQSPPQPLEIWVFALWFMKKGAALNATFATLLTLLGVAVTAVSDVYKRTVQLTVLTLLCAVGICACIYLMVKLDSPEALATLRYFGGFADDGAAESAVNWAFGSLMGWFVVFLAAQLGISSLAASGAIRRVAGNRPAERDGNGHQG